MLTSILPLTPVQTACPMAAAPTRQIPLLTATCFVHPIPGTSPHFFLNLDLTLTLCPAACRMFVPTPSKISSLSQILILKPCCCPAFTLTAKLIRVPHYNLTVTPSPNTLLCSHVGGPRWCLLPPSLFHTQRESSQYPLPILCLPLTPIHPVECPASL